MKKPNIILDNNSGNSVNGEGLVAIGVGLSAVGKDKVVLGRYNNPAEERLDDALVIGAGTSEKPSTILRVNRSGQVLMGAGGGNVYMTSPTTGEIIPVYMLDNDNKIKEVTL